MRPLEAGAASRHFRPVSSPLRDKLKSEVLATGVSELMPHFARGALLLVGPTLDLLDVACAIAEDDRVQIEGLIARGKLSRASDAHAREFVSQPTLRFQFVIVQPWVVAQVLP
jgi:hypothetical protein